MLVLKQEQESVVITSMQSPPRQTNQSNQQDVLSPMTQTTTGTSTIDDHSQDISEVTASTSSNSTSRPKPQITMTEILNFIDSGDARSIFLTKEAYIIYNMTQ